MKVIISVFFGEFICSSQRGHLIAPAALRERALITPLTRAASFRSVVGTPPFRNANSFHKHCQSIRLGRLIRSVSQARKDISMLSCSRLFRLHASSEIHLQAEQIQDLLHHNRKPPLFSRFNGAANNPALRRQSPALSGRGNHGNHTMQRATSGR